jgi:hypothetical protein
MPYEQSLQFLIVLAAGALVGCVVFVFIARYRAASRAPKNVPPAVTPDTIDDEHEPAEDRGADVDISTDRRPNGGDEEKKKMVSDVLSFDETWFATLAHDRVLVGGECCAIDFTLELVRGSYGVVLVYGEPRLLSDVDRPHLKIVVEPSGTLAAMIQAAKLKARALRSTHPVNGGTSVRVRVQRTVAHWALLVDDVEQDAFAHSIMAAVIPPSGLYIGGIELLSGADRAPWAFNGISGVIRALRFNEESIGAVERHVARTRG